MGKIALTSILIVSTVFFLVNCSIVSAEVPSGYYFKSYDGYQFRHGYIPNMSYLYDHTFYCNPDNNPVLDTNETVIRLNPDGSYTFKNVTKFTETYNGIISFENVTLCFEGPLTGTQGGFISGKWNISNAIIKTNDSATTPINFIAKDLYDYDLHNITFERVGSYTILGGVYTGNVYNIRVYNSTNGIIISNKVGGSIRDIYMENMTRQSFLSENGSNVVIDNITIEKGGDYLNPKTYVAFIVAGGHDNNVTSISVNGSPWSGVDLTGNEFNTTLNDIYVNHAGHNGVDFHGQWNCSIDNVTVNGSVAENFLIAGPDAPYQPDYGLINWTAVRDGRVTHNITIKNYKSYNATGSALSANRLMNLLVENLTSDSNGGGILINHAMGVKILNAQISNNTGGGITLGLGGRGVVKDVLVIDSSFNTYAWLIATENVNFINTKVSEYRFQSGNKAEYKTGHYADFLATDSKGNPISNCIILITANNTTFSSTSGFGNNQTTFSTQNNGHTALPNEKRDDSPAITEYYKNYPEGKYLLLSYTAAINTSDGRTVSLSGITPDSSWYRKDPNVPTYTITAIIPDNSTGPHITGFAPREDNPFNPGEKKIFRVWTDGNLTETNWTVDGKQLAQGALNYTWNVTEGNHTIEFNGVGANGNVIQVWNIGKKFGDNAPSDDNQTCDDNQTSIAEFLPENTAFTKNAGESVIFNVISDQLLEKNWFINGELAKSGTACISRSWSTPGTYNVTFSGSTCGGKSVIHTWIVDMIGSSEPENESIVRIAPEYQIVSPGKPFTLDIWIDPGIAIAGAQFDLSFKDSMLKVNGVSEGNLFSQNGASTYFSNGIVDSSAGLIRHVYGLILGESNVSSPGALARINLTAGNSTGIAEFSLSNTIISDTNSSRVPNFTNNSTVLIDTAPELDLIGSKSVDETENLTFTVSAKDTDGDNLAFSASGYPNGANFDPVTGVFTWIPSKGQGGTYTITFKVSDGYLNDSEDVKITVRQPNNAPSITSFEPANGSVFNEGDNIKIALNASDANGQALSYTIRIDGEVYSTSPSYIWNTNYSSSGSHLLELIVSDGIEETKKVNTIYINDVYPRWDVNRDGVVDVRDARMVSKRLGTTTTAPYPDWDVNQDGIVDMEDLDIVNYVIQNS